MKDKIAKTDTTTKAGMEAFVTSPALLEKLSEVSTPHMQPERLARVFMAAIATNPKILDCTPQSVAMALMMCSQLGLEPNTPFGHAYLIPYRDNRKGVTELQFQAGYKGLIALALRTGKVKRINANVFYGKDLEEGLIEVEIEPPKLVHHWSPDDREQDDIVGAYCVIEMTDGSICQEIMSKAELKKIAAKGNANSPMHKEWRDRACRKAPIKRLINGGTVPLQDRLLAMAVEHEIQADLVAVSGMGAKSQTRAAAAMDSMLAQVQGESIQAAVDVDCEVVSEEAQAPQTPATSGNGKPIACKVTDIPYLESLMKTYNIDLSEAWMIGEDELGFAPSPELWTEEQITEVWAVICERHQ